MRPEGEHRDPMGLTERYHWDYRPPEPTRPEWFTSWPNGARVAVTIGVLHEWESEPRSHRPMPSGSRHDFDFHALAAREYGARAGFPRVIDVLDSHDVRGTVFANGLVAELFPDGVRRAAEAGHAFASHQWDQSVRPTVYPSRDAEREALLKSLDVLENATGTRPRGYVSQGPRPSRDTLELCAELGLDWTADYSDADHPYTIDVHGSKMVSLGCVLPSYSDNELVPLGLSGALDQLVTEFEAVRREGERLPMTFKYIIHTFIGGRPGMAAVLDEFLGHVTSKDEVWLCTYDDMATFWRENEGW